MITYQNNSMKVPEATYGPVESIIHKEGDKKYITRILSMPKLDMQQEIRGHFKDDQLEIIKTTSQCIYMLGCESELYHRNFKKPAINGHHYHHTQEGKSVHYYDYKQFLEPASGIPRVKHDKSGDATILLGGTMYLKAIIRILPQSGIQARLLANSIGIPCEEILTNKKGKLRIYKDLHQSNLGTVFYRIYSKVEDGPNYANFLRFLNSDSGRVVKNKQEVIQFLEYQIKLIQQQMSEAGINHGHLLNHNFIVYLKEGLPFVKVIDRE